MGKKDIKAGGAFVELYLKSQLARGLRNASKNLKSFGRGAKTTGKYIGAIGASITAPMLGAIKSFMSAGDELDKMSSRVGASVEFLSALGYAANLGGTELKAMEVGMRRMQRSAYDAVNGTKTAADAFAQLGVEVKGADGRLKGTEALFMESAAALSAMTNETEKAALSTVIFGRAGTSLLPMLKGGRQGLLDMMNEARQLGLVMTTKDATAAADLTDAWSRLTKSGKMVAIQVGAQLAPMMKRIATRLLEVIGPVIQWVKSNGQLIIMVAKLGAILTAAGAAIFTVGAAAAGLGTALAGAATVAATFGTVLGAIISPIGAVIASVAALGYYILFHTQAGADALDWLGKNFQRLMEFVNPVIQGIKDALAAGDLGLAAKVAWLGIKTAFQWGKNQVMGVWRGFVTGMVQKFEEAIRTITDKWRTMNSTIAEGLVRLAGKVGLLGGLKAEDVIATLREDTARARGRDQQRITNWASGAAEEEGAARDAAALKSLREQLANAREDASTARAVAELKRQQAEPDAFEAPELGKTAPLAGGGAALGAFSAQAAALLGSRSNPQIKLLEAIDKGIDRLNQTVEDQEESQFA